MGYDTIRDVPDVLGIIGKRLVDVTSHDTDANNQDEFMFIEFLFEDGTALRVWLTPDGMTFRGNGTEEA